MKASEKLIKKAYTKRRRLCRSLPCAKDCIGQRSLISQERFTPTNVYKAVKIDNQCYDRDGLRAWLIDKGTIPHNRRTVTEDDIRTWRLDEPRDNNAEEEQRLLEEEQRLLEEEQRLLEEQTRRNVRLPQGIEDIDAMDFRASLYNYRRPPGTDPELVVARFHYANANPERQATIMRGEEDDAALDYFRNVYVPPQGGSRKRRKIKKRKTKKRRSKKILKNYLQYI